MELYGGDIPLWALLLVPALTLLYLYFTRRFNYWRTQGVPCLTRYPLFGAVRFWSKRTFHSVEEERYKKYGRLYGYYEGATPVLSCAEPDLLRDVLVKDFDVFPSGRDFGGGDPISSKMVSLLRGEDWKRVRTVMTPAFTLRKLKIVCERLKDCSKTLVENFSNAIQSSSSVNCRRYIDSYAVDVMSTGMFGSRIEAAHDPEHDFIKLGRKLFQAAFSWKIIMAIAFPKLAKLLGTNLFENDTIKYYINVSEQFIKDRKESGKRQNDFLQLMLDAHENALTTEEDDEKGTEVKDDCVEVGQEEDIKKRIFQQNVKSLNYEEMLAQCVLFLFGSFEGVGGAMCFACYCLALNPECQEKLIEEIDEAFQKNEELEYTVIRDMIYLDAVVKETLRLHPPAVRGERQAIRNYRLGNSGVIVPKGAVVAFPIYGMHHDPEYFPEPEKFIPDRFLPENKDRVTPYTYLPFGAGPRNCLGMRLVMLEIKYCIVSMFRNFRLSPSPETEIPVRFRPGQIFNTPPKMFLKVEPRTDIPNKR